MKALPLAVDVVAELSARCEVQRRELGDSSRLLAEARKQTLRQSRQLAQLARRLELAEDRVAQLEEEAAVAYARAGEREARVAAQLELSRTRAQETLSGEQAGAAAQIASLRDALAAALERERTFRRVEAELRRRLATPPGGGGGQNVWELGDARATISSVDSDEVAVEGLPLVP